MIPTPMYTYSWRSKTSADGWLGNFGQYLAHSVCFETSLTHATEAIDDEAEEERPDARSCGLYDATQGAKEGGTHKDTE
jgi:hypothetical protein